MKKAKFLIITIIFIILTTFISYKSIFIVGRKVFPLKEEKIISENSKKYGIDPYLVCAIIYTESKFNKNAISYKNAKGYMQIIEKTAMWIKDEIPIENFTYDDIFNPKYNIEIGVWYINRLTNQFGRSDVALASYNAGSGNVEKWLKNKKYSKDKKKLDVIPFKETKDYVKKVKLIKEVYKFLYKESFK